ncbi:hypothetical protein BGW36DRAFT_459434 [Talaromyces proteolyticus]|uniref:Zn(2)-C6 fungal-type domain-containing protein n=1 Tax=Talaromyces proteolyticus TaxID=1131652 RepID=A0AAD4KUF9_9EURO|nr:uncharacterized protein BGW36DRAFT_459434 [Talaromyces proteolyticus]KAH8700224.1 hypothetical protein BGW36DRAFT_459434 [Talaromyces proteolyticus]
MAASTWNLPTCNRCQKRKKKCDKILPSCANCTEAGLECVFYEKGSQSVVSRSAIQSLEEKARQLEAELVDLQCIQDLNSLSRRPISPESYTQQGLACLLPHDHSYRRQDTALGQPSFMESFSPSSRSSFSSNFVGLESAVDLCLSTAALAGLNTLDCAVPGGTSLQFPRLNLPLLRSEKLDRSTVEPTLIRGLVDDYYFPVLHTLYPVIERSQIELNAGFKQLPLKKRLFVILIAAIAAAHSSRRDQSLYPTALILRSWADDLISDVLARQDDDSLQAMILLTLYELVDPRRKLICHLLGLTCRMCIRLRWHLKEESILSTAEMDFSNHFSQYPSPRRRRLFCIVYEWESLVCLALQRVSIFSPDLVDMSSAQGVSVRTLYMELALRQKIRACSSHQCLLGCDFVSFVNANLEHSEGADILWLSVYLMTGHSWAQTATHEQYVSEWTDQILRAAMSRINTLFTAQRRGCIVSIWLSTFDVFTAGTVLHDISLRHPAAIHHDGLIHGLWNALRMASSLLAGFSELWQGAGVYRDVFDAISNRVFALKT